MSPDQKPIRLHLGCGEHYFPGYTNIDFPDGEHSVMSPKADIFQDIRTLQYEPGSVAEIRSHHVFEHFSRAETLALLRQWHGWLMPGGTLHIETPDFEGSIEKFLYADIRTQAGLGRHIFGSQEAKWAYHLDFWYAKKFRFVLKRFGFEHIRVQRFSNRLAQKMKGWRPLLNFFGDLLPDYFYRKHGGHKMPNIVVTATKSDKDVDFSAVIREILALYLVGKEDDRLLRVWTKEAGIK